MVAVVVVHMWALNASTTNKFYAAFDISFYLIPPFLILTDINVVFFLFFSLFFVCRVCVCSFFYRLLTLLSFYFDGVCSYSLNLIFVRCSMGKYLCIPVLICARQAHHTQHNTSLHIWWKSQRERKRMYKCLHGHFIALSCLISSYYSQHFSFLFVAHFLNVSSFEANLWIVIIFICVSFVTCLLLLLLLMIILSCSNMICH